jgi:hypothetical protein
MKRRIEFILISFILVSCGKGTEDKTAKPTSNQIKGTWQLVKAILIDKGDTTVTDYTKNISFIKVINETHFAFLQHDLNKGQDSAVFVAGGGTYSLKDSLYTEQLEYCSAREWEGSDFDFTIALRGDTLIQSGVEKVVSAGVNRINIEKYIKVKN